jgi:dTMP kinase
MSRPGDARPLVTAGGGGGVTSDRRATGIFITFEGVEGSGKSTQVAALERHLAERGVPFMLTREPGGTAVGEEVRRILLDHGHAGMLPLTELFLYLASRAEHVAHVVRPLLERGEVVIADRYADASVAYQGGGRELGAAFVRPLNEVATGGVKPDVTFLLDLDPEEGLSRLAAARGETAWDRIEREALEFHRRVRAAYLAAAEEEPGRFVVIDARKPPSEIESLIVSKVDELLRERSRGR